MHTRRFGGAILGLAVLGLLTITTGRAQAGPITVTVDFGVVPLNIDFNSPFAQAGSTANNINVDALLLNAVLAAFNVGYTVTNLGASSDNPGAASAQISVAGSVTRVVGGISTLSIGAFQTDFTAPSGSSTVTSVSAGTFTGQTSGSGHTASTAVGGTTVVPDYNVFSAGTSPNAVSASGSATVNLATPFTLSNVLNFALNPGATDNFSEAAAIGTPSVGSLLSPPSSPAPSASSNLTLSVDVGGITIPIDFNSAFALAGGSPNQVTVDTALLNTALVAIGSAYNFTTLGASSNDPGGTTAQINLDGSLTSANPGLFSFLSVTASQGGFTAPAGGSLTLTDASAATYIGQAMGGGHTAFGGIISGTSVSAFNVFSTGTGMDAAIGSGSAGVSPTAPYGLFNTLNFALSPGATDNFSGAVGVGPTTLGPPGTAVPEPGTFALTGIGLGVAGLVGLRRRGRRNPA